MDEYGKFNKVFLIGIFIFLINLMNLEVGYFLTIFDSILIDFRVEQGAIGWILLGFFLVQAISTILFGYYSDKFQRRKLFALGAFLYSFFCIIIYLNKFTENFIILLIFRSLVAIGLGCSTPIGISMMVDLIPSKNRSQVFAIYIVFTYFGTIWGVLFGFVPNLLETIVILITSSIDWENLYLYIGIAGFIGCGALLLFKEPKRAATEELFIEMISSGENYAYRIKSEDLKQIYTRRSNFWLIVNFIDTIAPGLLVNWILYYAEQDVIYRGISPIQIFISVGVVVGCLIGGTFVFAKIGDQRKQFDKTARAKIAIYCAIFNVPLIIVAFLFPRFGLIFTIFLAIGMAVDSGIGPNWYSTLIDVNPPELRGTMVAMASFLDTIGRGIGGLIGGYFGLEFSIIFLFLSIFPWLPVFKHIEKDLDEVENILKERVSKMSS